MKRHQFHTPNSPTPSYASYTFSLSFIVSDVVFVLLSYVFNVPVFSLNQLGKIKQYTNMSLPLGLIEILGNFLSHWIQKTSQIQTGSCS